MRFGAVIGCDLTKAEILKNVGYDFAEIDAGILAKISDDDFEDFNSTSF